MHPCKERATAIAAAFENAPAQGTGHCYGLQKCTHERIGPLLRASKIKCSHARNAPLVRFSNMHPR
eukprot:7063767-Lingulodinium_polyedra.AAC.1